MLPVLELTMSMSTNTTKINEEDIEIGAEGVGNKKHVAFLCGVAVENYERWFFRRIIFDKPSGNGNAVFGFKSHFLK